MRIAVFQPRIFIRGGADRFLFEVFRRMMKYHEIKVFCGQFSPTGFEGENDIPIEVIKGRRNLLGRFHLYFEGLQVPSILNSIRNYEADIVFVNQGYDYVDFLGQRCDAPIIPFVHGTVWYEPMDLVTDPGLARRIYRRLLRLQEVRQFGFRHCRTVMCVSRHVERFLRQLDPRIETVVVYPGVDHEIFRPTFDDHDYLLSITRFRPQKNSMLAIEAVQGTSYKLILYGTLEHGIPVYEAYVKKLTSKIESNIRIIIDTGQEDMIDCLQKCSLFLNPAIHEGFSLTSLEAMACGKVVLGHGSGGQSELLENVGFPCGDNPLQWRNHIARLMSDRELRIELGKRAHQFSLDFNWDKTSDRIREVIESKVRF